MPIELENGLALR